MIAARRRLQLFNRDLIWSSIRLMPAGHIVKGRGQFQGPPRNRTRLLTPRAV